MNAEFWPELIEPGVRGLLLTGSFARGQASHFSDLDLYRFWDQERRAHSWRVLDDRLLSLTETTLEEAYERLSRPDIWPWAAGGCRVARILYDPEGEMAQLLQHARSAPAPFGRAWALDELLGWCEEVGKLLASLAEEDPEKGFAPQFGLVRGMTLVMAVDRGIPIESENAFFSTVRQQVGGAWGEAQARALQGDRRATLRLFLETAIGFTPHPMLELTTRRVQAPLVQPLRVAQRESYQAMRAELWPDRAPFEQQQQVEQLLSGQAGLKETGRYQGYLAEDPLSGQPLGLLELELHEEGRGHLEGLYVTPERRRQGIGGSLLRWAVAELQRWGCRSVTSESWGEHTPGCGLPQRCGFVALDDHGLLEYRGPRLWPELPAPSA